MAKRHWRRFLPRKQANAEPSDTGTNASLRWFDRLADANAYAQHLKQQEVLTDAQQKLVYYQTL